MTTCFSEPRMTAETPARPSSDELESSGRRLKVLHVLDGLGGGGSERFLWDLVRLTDATQFDVRVATVWPDEGRFPYAERLRSLGAYRGARPKGAVPEFAQGVDTRGKRQEEGEARRQGEQAGMEPPGPSSCLSAGRVPFLARVVRRLPPRMRAPLSWIRGQGRFYGDHIARQWSAFRRLKAEHPGFVPDVIHAHLFDGLLMGLVCQTVWKRPLVYLVSALTRQMHDAGYWWAPVVLRHCHRRVNTFFLGAGFEADLATCGVPRDKMRPVTGVLDMGPIHVARNAREAHRQQVREEFGIPPSSPLLLSVGRLHHSKGHHLALDAMPRVFKRCPAAYWVLLGAGEERDALVERVRALGLSSRVHLAGFKADPLPYYAAADVYLRSHILEGDNLSSLQAMALGLPVVGFDTRAPNDLLPQVGHGLRVPLNDIPAFADAIVSLLDGSVPPSVAGARGARFADQELDIQTTVRQLEDGYRRLAEGRSGRVRVSSHPGRQG
jgi:glycosyltransferase involved in cell wall biosynthesis